MNDDSDPGLRQRSHGATLLILAAVVMTGVALFILRGRPAPQSAGLVSLRQVSRTALELREGLLYERAAEIPFSGVLAESYPDGTLLSRSELMDGRLHGVSEGWYTNRQVQIREHFVRGVSEGERVKWHPNGIPQSRAVIANGQIEGVFRSWHANGTLAEEVTMGQGKPVGASRSFYSSGCLQAQLTLRDGKVSEQQFWKDGEVPNVGGDDLAKADGDSGLTP